MFAVAIYGLIKGSPGRLFAPYDMQERFCGYDEGVEEYPYMFIANLKWTYTDASSAAWGEYEAIYKRVFFEEAVCVKQCPTEKK